MGLVDIIKPLSTVNKSQQHQEKNSWESRENQTRGGWGRHKYTASVLCSPLNYFSLWSLHHMKRQIGLSNKSNGLFSTSLRQPGENYFYLIQRKRGTVDLILSNGTESKKFNSFEDFCLQYLLLEEMKGGQNIQNL